MATNSTLLGVVRERMAQQTTEQLLDLWVTNDRATWSAEAFEAVKSLLAERGVRELPPQNDPAPVARRHEPFADPVARYWLGWLRPVLYIAIVAAATSLVHQAVLLRSTIEYLRRDDTSSTFQFVFWLVVSVVVDVWLIAASVACLRLMPIARKALMICAWVIIASVAIVLFFNLRGAGVSGWPRDYSYATMTAVQNLILPTILLSLLRRAEIKAAFAGGAAGFAVDQPQREINEPD